MKKVKITALVQSEYPELMAKYENPLSEPCSVQIGQSWCSQGEKPEGFCESAWQNLFPYVLALASGGGDFFDGWMKNPHSALISCNDGFRPVSFLLETMEENQ